MIDAWQASPPAYGSHLPGAVMPLAVRIGRSPVFPQNARHLHALVTGALLQGRAHDARVADFSLFAEQAAPSGWAVYVRDLEVARTFTGVTTQGILGKRGVALDFGPLTRLRAPTTMEIGKHRVLLTTLTPVVNRHSVGGPVGQVQGTWGTRGERIEGRPDLATLTSALTGALCQRLGVTVAPAELALRILSTRATRGQPLVRLHTGHGAERGWQGQVELVVGPLAWWLLLCATRIGLGARTSLGFGRVKVTPLPEDAPLVGIPYPEDTPEDHASPAALRAVEQHFALTPGQGCMALRGLLARAVHVEATRNGAQIYHVDDYRLVVEHAALGRRRVIAFAPKDPARAAERFQGAAGAFFITPYAVRRYIERVAPRLSFEEAREEMIRLTAHARRMGASKSASEVPNAEIWCATSVIPPHARIRFVVGHEGGKRLPFVATVLPIRDLPVRSR